MVPFSSTVVAICNKRLVSATSPAPERCRLKYKVDGCVMRREGPTKASPSKFEVSKADPKPECYTANTDEDSSRSRCIVLISQLTNSIFENITVRSRYLAHAICHLHQGACHETVAGLRSARDWKIAWLHRTRVLYQTQMSRHLAEILLNHRSRSIGPQTWWVRSDPERRGNSCGGHS